MKTPLRAVLFDVGGTLEQAEWSEHGALAVAARLLGEVRRLGAPIPARIRDESDMLESIVTACRIDRRRREDALRESTTEQLWADILAPDGGKLEHRSDSDGSPYGSVPALRGHTEELTVLFEQNAYLRTPVPGAVDLLQALLDDGFRLAVVSNVITRTRVPAALDEYGLSRFFEHTILSSVYGVRKPHPAVFHHAATLLGLPVSAVVHIGDRVNRDILGARRAGCGAVILFTGSGDFLSRVSTGTGDPAGTERESFPDRFFEPDAVAAALPAVAHFVRDRDRELSITAQRSPAGVRFAGLLFDATDVLYNRPSRENRFTAFRRELSLSRSREQVQRDGGGGYAREPHASSVELTELKRLGHEGRLSPEEYRSRVLAVYGIIDPDDVRRAIEAIEQDSDEVVVLPGVCETLVELHRRGVLLAVVSNTVLSLTRKLEFFERGGFGHIWDAIVLSCDVGVAKPDTGIYQIALERIGVSANQCAFVGHEQHELDGAHNAGLATIAFNGNGISGDYRIDRFQQLLELPDS